VVELIVRGQPFEFSEWPLVAPLNSARSVLDEGFLVHLERNPLLARIFDLEFAQESDEHGQSSSAKKV